MDHRALLPGKPGWGGAGERAVPNLLRRVAETLDELGEVEVQDLVLHAKTDDSGEPWPTVTVYFSRA